MIRKHLYGGYNKSGRFKSVSIITKYKKIENFLYFYGNVIYNNSQRSNKPPKKIKKDEVADYEIFEKQEGKNSFVFDSGTHAAWAV